MHCCAFRRWRKQENGDDVGTSPSSSGSAGAASDLDAASAVGVGSNEMSECTVGYGDHAGFDLPFFVGVRLAPFLELTRFL